MDLLNNGYYNSQAVQVLNAVEYDEFDNPIGLYESPSDPSSCNFTVSDNSRCKFVDSNCFQQQVSTCYMTVTGLLATDTVTVFGSSAVPTLSAGRMDFVVGSKYYGISIFRSDVLWVYYPMCETITTTTGFTYKDCSGNARHATIVNCVYGNQGKQSEFHYLQKGFNKSGNGYIPKHLTNNTDYLGNALEFQQDTKSFLPSGCYLQQSPTNTNLKLADSTVGLWYGPEGDPYKVSYSTLCLQDPWNEQVFIGNKTKDFKLGPISTHYNNLTPVQKLTERVVRNVVDDALIEDPAFSHDVTVTAGDLTYSLYNADGYTMNGIIDWGDGTTQSVNTTSTQTITKTYSVAGTYTVRFVGIMQYFSPSGFNSITAAKIIKINNWGNCDIKRMFPFGSTSTYSNLTSIPDGPITGVNQTSFQVAFQGCSKLTTPIPENLLLYASATTTCINLFIHCTSLTGQIPENLFRYCPNLTSVAGAFSGCTGITGQIPEDLLRYNTKLTNVSDLFTNCSRLSGSIPEKLFTYCPNITTLSSCFYGCTNLTGSLPAILLHTLTTLYNLNSTFRNCSKLSGTIPIDFIRYNPLITASSTFYNCVGISGDIPVDYFKYTVSITDVARHFQNTMITSIPNSLFQYTPLITTYQGTFQATSITSIPVDLFRYSGTNTTSFDSTFYGCTGITSIPPNLFDYNTNVITFANTFSNTRITTITSGLFVNNTKVTTFTSTFQNCTTLSLIPSNLFDTNTLVTSFTSTFQSCTSLTVIPVDIFKFNTEVTTFANCFAGCTNTSLTTLPTDLFRYNTKVTSFGGVFSNWGDSKTLTIPSDLFYYNVNVTYMGGAFSNTKIANIPTGLFDTNIKVITFSSTFYQALHGSVQIPTDLFRYNTLVTDMSQVFRYTNSTTSIPVDLFRYNTLVTTFVYAFDSSGTMSSGIPVDLFRYNTEVTDFLGVLSNCSATNNATVPEDLFYYNSKVTRYTSAFNGSRNLILPTRLFNTANLGKVNNWQSFMNVASTSYSPTGTIQKIWDVTEGGDVTYTVQPTKTDAFNNCTTLTNYSEIPVTWT